MYYTAVLIIATILLVIALTMVGITIVARGSKTAFPEFQNSCPDFWTLSGTVCSPSSAINTPNLNQIDITKTEHKGVVIADNQIKSVDISPTNWVSICDKTQWATANKILWDGVSNYNSC